MNSPSVSPTPSTYRQNHRALPSGCRHPPQLERPSHADSPRRRHSRRGKVRALAPAAHPKLAMMPVPTCGVKILCAGGTDRPTSPRAGSRSHTHLGRSAHRRRCARLDASHAPSDLNKWHWSTVHSVNIKHPLYGPCTHARRAYQLGQPRSGRQTLLPSMPSVASMALQNASPPT